MATVIKREHAAGRGTGTLQSFNLLDYETEARQILANARKQADLLLADAAAKAVKMREEARSLGHREGVDKGLDEGRRAGYDAARKQAADEFANQQANLVRTCEKAIAAIEEQKQRLFLAARTDVVRLAVAIARRVVKRLAAFRETAEAMAAENATEALDMIGPRTDPVLCVNPADLQAMDAFARGLAESARQKRHVRVIADASVEPGGCVLTTQEGLIDATLGTQLDRIAELLLGSDEATQRRSDEGEEGCLPAPSVASSLRRSVARGPADQQTSGA
jgi:flagellar assembly protein FliH